ncbi:MAG: hypothetical protein IPJ69_07220 [Deltaproteobacteria bacterium]|nr:MAG: hypothetical protein IPJ69_07220 [Deltaproteobacteria bacterium]
MKSILLWLSLIIFSSSAFAGPLHRRPEKNSPPPVAPESITDPKDISKGTKPLPHRWDIKPPPHELNVTGHKYDPYNQNILKGDYPIWGEDVFFIFTGVSDTALEAKKLPVPSNPSAAGPGRIPFFGDGNLQAIQQNFKFSFELYQGNTSFKPRTWALKVTPVLNVNYLHAQERGIVNASVANGTSRTQFDFALQEALVEVHLANVSPYYDFISIRGGIQPFTSDFRGLIFSDTNFGGRLFGNLNNNKIQWNVAYFDMLEKNTNSELNMLERRDQQVLVANLYSQDFLGVLGWTNQFSVHYNHDRGTTHYDVNGILTRPDPAGAATNHELNSVYLGWTSDGHIGRINVNHAFYFALGKDSLNPQAGQKVDIEGQLAALELSYDRDWIRFRSSAFYSSGDSNPRDDKAKGFDSIFDLQKFAGGENSFFNHEAIRLNGVNLVQRNSLIPSLRSSKIEGQSNFVNPGLLLLNVGPDFEILQTLRAIANINYLRFIHTEPLEIFLNQSNIRKDIGWDYSLGLQYRPFLNNNVIVNVRGALFQPLGGFEDILTSNILYSAGTNLILTF